jgi:hypothetical protein
VNMGEHPNVLLIARLTPDGLARKTMRDILAESEHEVDDDIDVGGVKYHHHIMEEEYYESYQISGKEGDLIFFDLVTYGYGEEISWEKLEAQKNVLEAWAKQTCEKHSCGYEIVVSANMW